MSMTFVLMLAVLGQVASAEDLIAQMQAQDDQIRTLEFLFRVDQVKGPNYFDVAEKVLKTTTHGRLRFRAPHEVKLERLSESGEVLEARAISADGAKMNGFSLEPVTGSVSGFTAKADFKFYLTKFAGVDSVFRYAQFEGLRLRFLTGKAKTDSQVTAVGKLLRLSRPATPAQFDVDPARGYWVVATNNAVSGILRRESTEPLEFLPGIWIAKRAEIDQRRNGKVFLTATATVDLNSVRINQPLDAKAFEIIFPKGTRVDNLITNTSEYVGGKNSRDRKSVEQLAAANNIPAPVAPSADDLVPASSALRVPETSLWNATSFIAVVAGVLLLGGGWFGWQRWWR